MTNIFKEFPNQLLNQKAVTNSYKATHTYEGGSTNNFVRYKREESQLCVVLIFRHNSLEIQCTLPSVSLAS